MKNKDDQIFVSNVYLFYDLNKRKLVACQHENYRGIRFICSPKPTNPSERYSFKMYPTHNLYYIISNGGVELTEEQAEAINKVRRKVVGHDNLSRINNENTATLSREEIHSLITEIDEYITKHQIRMIAKEQNLCDETLFL